MAQKKGQTGNPNGRPKGKPNKVTTDLRQWLSALIDGNRKTFEADMKKILPAQRLAILEKLLQFCIPRMASVDANVDLARLTDEQINLLANNILNKIDNENSN